MSMIRYQGSHEDPRAWVRDGLGFSHRKFNVKKLLFADNEERLDLI